MRSGSTISSSLGKRRRKHFWLKVLFLFTFLLVVIAGLISLTHYSGIRILEITVIGNGSVPESDIKDFVKSELDKGFLFVIARDNIVLCPRIAIKNGLTNQFKKLKSAEVSFGSLNNINISVSDRVEAGLWCSGLPSDKKQCYFMDSFGFVFAEAPDFSGSPFQEYFGMIKDVDPIGQNYFDSETFSKMTTFFAGAKDAGFSPETFLSLGGGEYEIGLALGGKINLNDKKDFSESLRELKALVDDGYIKTDTATLSKINHIDLRYGNKVHFDYYK